jgi:multidrug transporter EmrE-like cation transporter
VILCLLNLAMAHYPQLDVIPVYESMGICMTIVAGMIFFDEGRYYTSA